MELDSTQVREDSPLLFRVVLFSLSLRIEILLLFIRFERNSDPRNLESGFSQFCITPMVKLQHVLMR